MNVRCNLRIAVGWVGVLLLMGCSESKDESVLTPELMQGKAVVEKTCIACHGQGLNGAPIIGNSKMWAKRLPQGVDVLVDHAINGYAGMMPPKGGNPDLTDQEVHSAVLYFVSQVQATD